MDDRSCALGSGLIGAMLLRDWPISFNDGFVSRKSPSKHDIVGVLLLPSQFDQMCFIFISGGSHGALSDVLGRERIVRVSACD